MLEVAPARERVFRRTRAWRDSLNAIPFVSLSRDRVFDHRLGICSSRLYLRVTESRLCYAQSIILRRLCHVALVAGEFRDFIVIGSPLNRYLSSATRFLIWMQIATSRIRATERYGCKQNALTGLRL